MRLEHHLVGGYVRYISPHIIIIYYYYSYASTYVYLVKMFTCTCTMPFIKVEQTQNYIDFNPNPQGIWATNHPKPSKIHQLAVKRYPNCWTLMELAQYQMQSIHGLAIHSPESNKSSRWSLMDLVHMATCSIHWAILWSTESIKIRQNQE